MRKEYRGLKMMKQCCFSEKVVRQLEDLRGCPFIFYEKDNEERIHTIDHCAPELLQKTPLVSVLMLTFNHEKYISEAIEGIVNQKFEHPFELVIGDDCSTDRTLEICLEYQKKYPEIIRVLDYEKNLYRNGLDNGTRVIRRLRGKYYALCEGDDYWCDFEKLSKQIAIFENSPEIGLVFGNGFVLKESGEKVYFDMSRKIGADRRASLFNVLNEGFITNTIMMRADCFKRYVEKSLFYRIRMGMGDCKFISDILLVQNYAYAVVEAPLAVYRLHSGSFTMSNVWIDAKRDAYLVNGVGFWGAEGALKNRVFRRKLLSYSLVYYIMHREKTKIFLILLKSIRWRAPLGVKNCLRALIHLLSIKG